MRCKFPLRIVSLATSNPIYRVDEWSEIFPHLKARLEVLSLLLLLMRSEDFGVVPTSSRPCISVSNAHIKDCSTLLLPEAMNTCVPSLLGCLHSIDIPSGWCVCRSSDLPCKTTNAGKNSRFAFYSSEGKGSATEVPPLIRHIIMPNMNQPALLA